VKTTICGIPVRIVLHEGHGRGDGNYGEMDGKSATIHIDQAMPKAVREATLVHEWMHAVFEYNGIEHTEVQVAVLSTELYRQGFRIKVEP